MTVEADVVRRKLLEINEATGHLCSWIPITVERLETDQQLRWAVERGLQVAAEVLFDAGAQYFGHLGWAAAFWIAGSGVWLAFLGPRLFR